MTVGVDICAVPRLDAARRDPSSPRHSTQCCPTADGSRHSGHADRPHLLQESKVGRSGCR
ncbi:hypothetical protein A5777_23495 [Gordonia sp. 852002-10350_SCH5691597]|nr:hypothetical protein A5777_23495 [Gordonia sp. 852002-10350_SCH5691597]